MEHALTNEQTKKFNGKRPDYVLYETGTENPIAIIEAKRPGQDIDSALRQAIDLYATPLSIPIAFAFDDVFVSAKHLPDSKTLKIDGEELKDFVDELTALRFMSEGAEIYSAPKGMLYNREQLLKIFKVTNNLLRDEGLRDGYERFSAFAEILFLKLVDEAERLRELKGKERIIKKKYCWSSFVTKYKGSDLVDFIHDTVWPKLEKSYGDIFARPFSIRKAGQLTALLQAINPVDLTSTDTDVKGAAFEYFLRSVTNGNKDLGEYFTPRQYRLHMYILSSHNMAKRFTIHFAGRGDFCWKRLSIFRSGLILQKKTFWRN